MINRQKINNKINNLLKYQFFNFDNWQFYETKTLKFLYKELKKIVFSKNTDEQKQELIYKLCSEIF